MPEMREEGGGCKAPPRGPSHRVEYNYVPNQLRRLRSRVAQELAANAAAPGQPTPPLG